MADTETITLFHAPQSRSLGARTLLEELGAPYDLQVLKFSTGEQRAPAYLDINPMGKVPAIRHGGALITEQVAVMLYLGDLFPGAGITPAIDDPRRGPYLRWMVFYAACFEPAAVDKALKRDGGSAMMSPYGGDFDLVLQTVTAPLREGAYMLGDRFTVADVLWGVALNWMVLFGIVPESPEVRAYLDRVNERPAFKHTAALDNELAAHLKAP
jgi:glutathione S-transferase